MCLQTLFYKLSKCSKSLVVVLCSIGIVACSSSNMELLTGVSQETANTILMLLGNNNINAVKQVQKDGTYTIMVSGKQKLEALNILNAHGMPQHEFTNLGEVFKKDSFIASPLEEHSRFLYALDQEIASMLSSLNGVTSVKTIVNLPASNDNLWQNKAPDPSASVLIKYRQGERIDLYINRIKELVCNSVPGLTADKVEVVTVVQKDD